MTVDSGDVAFLQLVSDIWRGGKAWSDRALARDEFGEPCDPTHIAAKSFDLMGSFQRVRAETDFATDRALELMAVVVDRLQSRYNCEINDVNQLSDYLGYARVIGVLGAVINDNRG